MNVRPTSLSAVAAFGSIRLLAPDGAVPPPAGQRRGERMIVLPISLSVVAAFGSIRLLALMEPCSRPPTGGEDVTCAPCT